MELDRARHCAINETHGEMETQLIGTTQELSSDEIFGAARGKNVQQCEDLI